MILISTILITIIIGVQLFWLQKVYLYEEKQFNINVSKSIQGVYNEMQLVNDVSDNVQKVIENPSPDVYLLRIDCSPNLDSLWINLKSEFTDFDVYTDCKAAIYSVEKNDYTVQKYIDLPDSYHPLEKDSKMQVYKRDYSYVALYFPHRGQYILKQMLFWIASSGLLLLVLIGFGASIFYLYRQKFLNETQRDFVNNFTHEFRTPLAVIKIAADVLQQENIVEKPDRLANYAGIINEQTTHLQAQIQRLLDIAYTDRSRLPLEKENFDGNAMLQQAIADLQPLIERRQAVIETALNAMEPMITADKAYLLLAVINLIENAIKYSPQPVIKVSSWNAGPDFCISVKDNGIGINPAFHKKIFDRFYRVTQGEIHTTKGFGLGLNFVKKVIDAHGGKIEVQSEEKKGSTFILKIPIK
ncbi:MAG TPA: HAMP domain-containing sensor histidine kinase [Ferruginibacter sp.]|nr:HAMP domain-containing sensor histidine kinase [Ferruginibacter sp.]